MSNNAMHGERLSNLRNPSGNIRSTFQPTSFQPKDFRPCAEPSVDSGAVIQSANLEQSSVQRTVEGHRQLKYSQDLYGELWPLLNKFQEATLITLNSDGTVRMSKIDAPRPDFHGNVWVFLSPEHPCLGNIRLREDICLTYGDETSPIESASLSGSAQIITDPLLKRSRWNALRWHGNKMEIDWRRATLVRMTVDYFEYWHAHQSHAYA